MRRCLSKKPHVAPAGGSASSRTTATSRREAAHLHPRDAGRLYPFFSVLTLHVFSALLFGVAPCRPFDVRSAGLAVLCTGVKHTSHWHEGPVHL